ncbi:DUF4871 domain-containing protein [Bacillus pseudomycoides]|uniref:DUF4871 domain-containing protein n=1 Tax=Bacillus pseudomycoides TaxID=64104 RepID=A0AA91VE12_9BACI|nr:MULTISPECIES: DUF4871 domain-containing protein [Bacillus]PEB53610.1 DUF4871 domain-containing protein [Bacillus sp. AFS098217]PED83271.1 DUF4871 domain-containing protein [Bacillus pseudomycoides]PEU18173.1 DUF4871 domain-containing protein [Bacillus sp. AFS019443]PEU22232.1 DUF4871 domain-containing protein [Bacillus sp. AFS014408]PFW65656.1 DUF4871 domain-containing protein [Bacillus sp. AFS075034]
MKKIGTALLFTFLISGCAAMQQDSKTQKKEIIEASNPQTNAPSFFHLSVLKDVNWEESPSFVEGKTPLKGIEGKIAIADSSFTSNEKMEHMWFFLDPQMPTGKFSIIALKQGSTTPTPVIFSNENFEKNWTAPNQIQPDIKEMPLLMSLPSSGLWLLNVYVNEKYYEQLVINVE